MNDSINTRTSIETHRKGSCYMPRTREEYEEHLNNIVKAGLKFVILWQDPNLSISKRHDSLLQRIRVRLDS